MTSPPGLKLKDPARFGERLVELALGGGYGALSKKDLDLLLFHLLERDGCVGHDRSNHEVARLLRVTVARARAIRREAAARWAGLGEDGEDDPSAQLALVLKRVLSKEALGRARAHTPADDRKDGFVGLLVAHPADRDALERAVLETGVAPRSGRHPDVLVVAAEALVALAEARFEAADVKTARRELEALAREHADLEEILTKPLGEWRRADVRRALNLAGAKLVVGQAEELLPKLLGAAFPILRMGL